MGVGSVLLPHLYINPKLHCEKMLFQNIKRAGMWKNPQRETSIAIKKIIGNKYLI